MKLPSVFIGAFLSTFLLTGPAWGEQKDRIFIRYDKFRLSADVQRVPVSRLVKELQKRTGIEFSFAFLPDIKISQKFNNLPLESGIKSLLPLNTIFVYGGSQKGIESVIILSSFKSTSPEGEHTASPATSEKRKVAHAQPANLPPFRKVSPRTEEEKHEIQMEKIDSKLKQIKDGIKAYPWIQQLKDPDPGKRLEAVKGLGSLGTKVAQGALYLALDDQEKEVRDTVIQNLKEISERSIQNSFKEALDTPDEENQYRALMMIEAQSGPKWVELLEENIKSNSFVDSLVEKAKKVLIKLKKVE